MEGLTKEPKRMSESQTDRQTDGEIAARARQKKSTREIYRIRRISSKFSPQEIELLGSYTFIKRGFGLDEKVQFSGDARGLGN